MTDEKVKEATLRVWWMPQVPMTPFYVSVKNLDDAILLLDALANYDLFQLENRIKPDYSNAGGLEIFEDGEWSEYYDEHGNDIDQIIEDRERMKKVCKDEFDEYEQIRASGKTNMLDVRAVVALSKIITSVKCRVIIKNYDALKEKFGDD